MICYVFIFLCISKGVSRTSSTVGTEFYLNIHCQEQGLWAWISQRWNNSTELLLIPPVLVLNRVNIPFIIQNGRVLYVEGSIHIFSYFFGFTIVWEESYISVKMQANNGQLLLLTTTKEHMNLVTIPVSSLIWSSFPHYHFLKIKNLCIKLIFFMFFPFILQMNEIIWYFSFSPWLILCTYYLYF